MADATWFLAQDWPENENYVDVDMIFLRIMLIFGTGSDWNAYEYGGITIKSVLIMKNNALR